MRDPYLVDEKVGEIADHIEQTRLSPENVPALHDALIAASEETGASVASIASKLAKTLDKSNRIKPARKEYLVEWLAEHYVPYASRR